MEPKQYYIGIDVGGTSVKEGLFDEDGNLLAKASVPTPPIVDAAGFAAVTEAIDQVVAKARIPRAFVAGIGLAVPCPIPASGDAKVKANIAINLPELRIAIQQHCPDAVVKYENDANAAALAEALAGAARGTKNSVMITLGTGVGGGIIIDGKIYSGFNFAGGELGHVVIVKDGRQCGCGRRGCWETYSSATGLTNMTREKVTELSLKGIPSVMVDEYKATGKVTARTAFDGMRRGDKAASEVVDMYISYLACGIANMVNIFQPEVLSIGGGICNEKHHLLDPLQAIVDREQYTRNDAHKTVLKIAEMGNDAGIVGAAGLGL